MRRASGTFHICSRCLQTSDRRFNAAGTLRHARTLRSATPPSLRPGQTVARKEGKDDDEIHNARDIAEEKAEQGAMTRRLAEMAEETMDLGSKSDRNMMKDVGFSEDLKMQLEQRIAQATFRSENQQALSQADMPSYAGKGTRDQAATQAWTGNENLHDSALRMLDDSHRRIRIPSRAPRLPIKDLRPMPKSRSSPADRLAKARDKTSIYAFSKQEDLTEKEREKMRQEMKERFTPGARPMPTTLQGLTSLANERIEDAIARGQFRNIARGKGVNTERDYQANSPFLDTTEYFMNKIIQKQEIVPPWIEKQQEVVKNVASFRNRLRHDWKRHVARSIASKGGSVPEQVRRARAFALAEERVNPRPFVKVERLSEIDEDGNIRTVSVEERTAHVVPIGHDGDGKSDTTTITVTETTAEDAPKFDAQPALAPASEAPAAIKQITSPSSPPPVLPMAYPFRDPEWERIELAYHNLAISDLNSTTRSYNLMAPKLVQKPYYTLERELKRCFADVAPLVADEIEQRARAPRVNIIVGEGQQGGVLEGLAGSGHVAKVRDEDYGRKGYGFRQFWRDIFKREAQGV